MQRILEERFQETLGQINWETGDVAAAATNAKGETTRKLTAAANQQSMELKSILARVRAIEAARDSITSETTKAKLNAQINQIYRDLNFLITGMKRGQIGNLKNTNINTMNLIPNQRVPITDATGQNMISTINTLLKTYASIPAINLQKGDLFEYLIALAPAVARINAGEALEDMANELESKVSGGNRSRVKINFDKNEFTQSLNLKNLEMKGYVVSEGKQTAYSYGTSQEKIDVNLEWGGKNLAISAKNVNLKSNRGVHILSGSSLLYLLQDEDNDFVNHYLNIVASHEDGVKINADITGAHNAIKYTILFKALTGETYLRQGADTFVVNDNTTGKVRVYDMNALIKKASDDLDAYCSITANDKPIESMVINNARKATYSDRITSFIGEVHKQKISAALKPSLLL